MYDGQSRQMYDGQDRVVKLMSLAYRWIWQGWIQIQIQIQI
jgi:hypothetical protein